MVSAVEEESRISTSEDEAVAKHENVPLSCSATRGLMVSSNLYSLEAISSTFDTVSLAPVWMRPPLGSVHKPLTVTAVSTAALMLM